ncbi:N-succinylarginine dihydrolase [Aureliella helgolandensis]|uniref:N-succinylarginine dihydrolase n=1 Tax=Aureliella helgolandensis TaxID=2527968 RepID=A0A518GHL9_9BACT|nr:N-succinylarginine dihydrolase [Aureliella helgolandensis]
MGFNGAPSEQVSAAYQSSSAGLSAAYSSAFMWAANAATFSPARDCRDTQAHFTPANLLSSWHRGSEAGERAIEMQQLYPHGLRTHSPLPAVFPLRDEGAANHMRLSDPLGKTGLNVFVHGEFTPECDVRFMPRHTLAASQAIARLHQLDPQCTFFLQQHPAAIAAGVFHNDVIATSHENLLIYHQFAFVDGESEIDRVADQFERKTGAPLVRIEVGEAELSLSEAVACYFF